jgi:hypothetical protein
MIKRRGILNRGACLLIKVTHNINIEVTYDIYIYKLNFRLWKGKNEYFTHIIRTNYLQPK